MSLFLLGVSFYKELVRRPSPRWLADLQADLMNASTAEEAYFVDTESYTTDVSELQKRGFNKHPDVQIKIFPGEGGLKKGFIITGKHVEQNRGTAFVYGPFASGNVKEIPNEEFERLLSQSAYPFEKEFAPVKNTSP